MLEVQEAVYMCSSLKYPNRVLYIQEYKAYRTAFQRLWRYV